MNKTFTVNIDQNDCDEGVRNNSHYCVVHTAIGRVVPEATRIEITAQTIRFTLEEDGKRHRLVFLTPAPVREYIIAFDAGDEPRPMKFVLRDPQITTTTPKPAGAARTVTFRASKPSGRRRSLRVFGEKAMRANQHDKGKAKAKT